MDSETISEVKDTKITISSLESSVSQPVTKSVVDGKIKDTTNIVKKRGARFIKELFILLRHQRYVDSNSFFLVPSNSYCSEKIIDDEKKKNTTSRL